MLTTITWGYPHTYLNDHEPVPESLSERHCQVFPVDLAEETVSLVMPVEVGINFGLSSNPSNRDKINMSQLFVWIDQGFFPP